MHVPPDALPPRPVPLDAALGLVRMAGLVVLLVGGTAVLLAAALLPVRRGRVRPAVRVAEGICRAFLWVTGTRLVVEGADALRQHRGFVFFNHLSFLDPIVLVAAAPMRFLSTQGVRSIPFVGWMATALGTIYVNRGRDESREAARRKLQSAVAGSPTPVALAPEGQIGPGPGVLPFRRGAFEVAADAGAPVLLVALRFEPHAYALWKDEEWLVGPAWRLCARRRPFTATVTALPPTLSPDADPATAAADAERRLDAVLLGHTTNGSRPAGGDRRPRGAAATPLRSGL